MLTHAVTICWKHWFVDSDHLLHEPEYNNHPSSTAKHCTTNKIRPSRSPKRSSTCSTSPRVFRIFQVRWAKLCGCRAAELPSCEVNDFPATRGCHERMPLPKISKDEVVPLSRRCHFLPLLATSCHFLHESFTVSFEDWRLDQDLYHLEIASLSCIPQRHSHIEALLSGGSTHQRKIQTSIGIISSHFEIWVKFW